MVSDIRQEFRGDGTTSKQMKEAPKNAVYVWLHHDLSYPIMLSRKLEREDLKIVSHYWLSDHKYKGMDLTGVILDHAYIPDLATYKNFKEALIRVRK